MRYRIQTSNQEPNIDYIAANTANFAQAMSNFNEQIILAKKLKFPIKIEVSRV